MAVNEQEVAALVVEFVRRIAPTRPSEVGAKDEFVRNLGYNSLTMIELQFALENLFGLEPISHEEALKMWSVADLTGFVHAQLESGEGALPEPRTLDLMRDQLPFQDSGPGDAAG